VEETPERRLERISRNLSDAADELKSLVVALRDQVEKERDDDDPD